MTCPYLKEVSMVFCRAYPVKKPVPIDRVTTASTCEGEVQGVPLALPGRAGRGPVRSTAEEENPIPAAPKGATP